ncbi:DUF726-domain-containing protein [Eremomyces bilateralis CBS 781.70]|uniref:DUF726-domain-containing protein n=1 Tax=Eremomyces bilateralis CBS 781.70 TaxID=1392243 RepID=A0A6G1G950_9PEZI|nr:DUF726-domain-containing protein [Eremomyces bilateralis CBS 781.70]KAF1814389.1 DUF726-domain-containing protein [Eremomyces bilateralis CBS 781.70]
MNYCWFKVEGSVRRKVHLTSEREVNCMLLRVGRVRRLCWEHLRPVTADWRKMRAMVAGRLVNVYSDNDYTLAFLYRRSSIQFGIAGLQAIQGVKGVENVDVSDMVTGHTAYRYLTWKILQRIGFEEISVVEMEREEKELQEVQAQEEAVHKTWGMIL